MPHITPARFLDRVVTIALIGCGGNGSQMLTGLARLNHSLRALGHPGLHVCVFDPDTVSEANMGRQLFGAFDVGSSKAHVLVNRINAFFGLDWQAHFGRWDAEKIQVQPDMLICCVDSAKSRHEIMRSYGETRAAYIMDMGNRAADGQVLFGEPDGYDARVVVPSGSARLPDPYRVLPELVDLTAIEDDTPSCGLAEALERQELFINQAIVTPALSILWEFFRHGRLTWHGAFINLRTGSMRPLLVKDAAPVPEAADAEEVRVRVMA